MDLTLGYGDLAIHTYTHAKQVLNHFSKGAPGPHEPPPPGSASGRSLMTRRSKPEVYMRLFSVLVDRYNTLNYFTTTTF